MRLTEPATRLVEAPPRVAVAPAGETVVAWLERTPLSREELVVSWLSAVGSPLASHRHSGAAVGSSTDFDVAVDRFDRTLSVRGAGESGIRAQLFDAAGLPGFQFLQARWGGTGGHTNLDFFDTLPLDDLKRNAVIMAVFVYQAAMADDLLPRKGGMD